MSAPPLLDAAAIARLGDLELRARVVVEGALAGLHRSPHHGASVEFAEHKRYAPGDDIRRIDWKAYGRVDRYYVKRFEEETELRAYLVLDCSASMGYGADGRPSKLVYGSQVAAGLAHLILRQRDQAGLVAFAETIRHYLPPRARPGQLRELLTTLAGLVPDGRTDLRGALDYVAQVARRRSLIVLLSDLLDGGDDAVRLLRGLRARRHDVVLLHLLDGDELELPFRGPTCFVGLEDHDELLADPEAVGAAYRAEVAAFVAGLRRGCALGDVEYHLVDTRRPPGAVLLELLALRGASPR